MHHPLSTPALSLALAVVLVAIAPPAAADAGKPAWSPGDFWAYSHTGSVFDWVNGPGTYRMEVVGVDTVSVGTASYEAYRLRLTMNGSNLIEFHGGDVWYRTSDLSLVKLTYNVTVTVLFQFTVILTLTHDPPVATRWPLRTQDTWTSSSTRSTVTQILPFGPGNPVQALLDTSYVVEATSTVTVPGGTFETTPLRAQSGERSTTYWAPSAGNYARRQTFDGNNQETSSAELTSYRYQDVGFLGMPLLVWLLIVVLVIVAIMAVAVRRGRRRSIIPPPGYPPR